MLLCLLRLFIFVIAYLCLWEMENQIGNACLTQAWNEHSLNLKVTLFSGSRKQIATGLEKSLSTCCHSDQSHQHSKNGASSLWCRGFLMELGQWRHYSTMPSCINTPNTVPAVFSVVGFGWKTDSYSIVSGYINTLEENKWRLLFSALQVLDGPLCHTNTEMVPAVRCELIPTDRW